MGSLRSQSFFLSPQTPKRDRGKMGFYSAWKKRREQGLREPSPDPTACCARLKPSQRHRDSPQFCFFWGTAGASSFFKPPPFGCFLSGRVV